MAYTAGVRFPRARPQPPHSQKPLVVGSSEAHDVLAQALRQDVAVLACVP